MVFVVFVLLQLLRTCMINGFTVHALTYRGCMHNQRVSMTARTRHHSIPSLSASRTTHDVTNSIIVPELIHLVRNQMEALANSQKAQVMQKYLKTEMPMYGIPRPTRLGIETTARAYIASKNKNATTLSMELYLAIVKALWESPMREEKYLAIDLAIHYKDCITKDALPLYEAMLREDYMWWDLVDPIATHLVGKVASKIVLKRWIQDDNIWIRRSAILAQLKWKSRTDEALLFQLCRTCMHEKEFFIRKAIGWALREYSKTAPDAVKTFLEKEKPHLSGLSYREGAKILIKQGLM